ncbi:PorP/SprF family type IX secretion system membrane protein [Flavobacterium filum]|uniref:PorP/SprF family type IX secretion system membrane protein n=1 Tax=Flavobacterium filum TaxID=370974 RepID=UPI00068434EA|nr:PorP/SprF family type IX secretion system membrane protein [Flavobacterium filum]
MFKKLIIIMFTGVVFANLQAQDTPILTFTIPTQNTLLLNRFMMNPTFSAVRENDSYITLYHRNQWIQFDDSPELYMLSYSGKYGERAGVGIGIYQQNLGIITSFGGVGNYAYQIPIREKVKLTLGFNVAYYNSGVDRNRAVTNEPDPAIMALRNNSLLSVKPALNVTWGSFDFGVYAENFVDYDFKSSKMVKEYAQKTYTGHVMYHHQMQNQEGLFENGFFRLIARGKMNQTDDFVYGGSVITNFPNLGWVQAGIDDFYGVNIGVGAHFTKKLSLGYAYERVINDGLVNFGPTHEITLSYRFAGKENEENVQRKVLPKKKTTVLAKKPKAIKQPLEEVDELEEEEEEYEDIAEEPIVIEPAPKSKKTALKKKKPLKANVKMEEEEEYENEENEDTKTYNKEIEVEKLKMTLDERHLKLLEIILKQDAEEQLKKGDFEKRIDNMMQYIERLEKTIAEKDCNCEPKSTTVTEEKTIETTTKTTIKNENSPAKKESKSDLENKLSNMKSSTKREEIKLSSQKNNSKQNELEAKISQLKKEEPKTNTNSKFTLTDEEIKEYYSRLTDKKRATAKKGNFLQVENQEPGFYIIANVFSEPAFADDFIQKLKKQGINAHYFINPKNNFRYVYLKKHSDWSEALITYYTNVDNTYFEEIWIMNINIK